MKAAEFFQYLLIIRACNPNTNSNNFMFVTSFLQGAQSNTAIRKHYYNTQTLQKAKSLLLVDSKTRTNTSTQNTHPTLYRERSTSLFGLFNSNEEDDNDDDDNDKYEVSASELETARKSFEDMFAIPNDNKKKEDPNSSSSSSYGIMENENSSLNDNSNDIRNNNNHKDKERETITKARDITKIANSIPQPPLTAIGRERRLKEITLLSTLTQSDDAVSELWALWIQEKGPTTASLLLQAEQLMSIESYDEAESLLWSLIHQYGVHWAEPVNRLATLKYMQGRLEESKKLCETVLQSKPWHFGALSGIVLVCTAMNDATGARMWAGRRMPPLIPDHTSGDRRVTWIGRALDDATESLTVASKVGRSAIIGKEEIEFRTFRAQMQNLNMESPPHDCDTDDDQDAWQ